MIVLFRVKVTMLVEKEQSQYVDTETQCGHQDHLLRYYLLGLEKPLKALRYNFDDHKQQENPIHEPRKYLHTLEAKVERLIWWSLSHIARIYAYTQST